MNESTHQHRVIDAIIQGEYATIDASAINKLESDLNTLSKSEAESYFHPKEAQSFLSGIIHLYQQKHQLGLKALDVFQTWLREKDILYALGEDELYCLHDFMFIRTNDYVPFMQALDFYHFQPSEALEDHYLSFYHATSIEAKWIKNPHLHPFIKDLWSLKSKLIAQSLRSDDLDKCPPQSVIEYHSFVRTVVSHDMSVIGAQAHRFFMQKFLDAESIMKEDLLKLEGTALLNKKDKLYTRLATLLREKALNRTGLMTSLLSLICTLVASALILAQAFNLIPLDASTMFYFTVGASALIAILQIIHLIASRQQLQGSAKNITIGSTITLLTLGLIGGGILLAQALNLLAISPTILGPMTIGVGALVVSMLLLNLITHAHHAHTMNTFFIQYRRS